MASLTVMLETLLGFLGILVRPAWGALKYVWSFRPVTVRRYLKDAEQLRPPGGKHYKLTRVSGGTVVLCYLGHDPEIPSHYMCPNCEAILIGYSRTRRGQPAQNYLECPKCDKKFFVPPDADLER